MSESLGNLLSIIDRNGERVAAIAEKMFAAANPGAVFGEPVTAGEYTLITASEVTSGGGFGSGAGVGPDSSPKRGKGRAEMPPEPEGQDPLAGGGGMGGGGGAMGRPVAVIIVGPEGVRVRPVVDATKIALAAITAWGAMGLMMRAMRRRGRRGAE